MKVGTLGIIISLVAFVSIIIVTIYVSIVGNCSALPLENPWSATKTQEIWKRLAKGTSSVADL